VVVVAVEKNNDMDKNILTESTRLKKLAGINEEDKSTYMEDEDNYLPDPELLDDVPSVKLHINDHGLMRIKLSAFYHGPENGKIPLLKDNPVLQELVMKAIQMESQKAFRRAVHSVLGIPYGLKQ
jgi:hypothetical protein